MTEKEKEQTMVTFTTVNILFTIRTFRDSILSCTRHNCVHSSTTRPKPLRLVELAGWVEKSSLTYRKMENKEEGKADELFGLSSPKRKLLDAKEQAAYFEREVKYA